jgi:hypothetical protein
LSKEIIRQNDDNPLWLECIKRFSKEVKAPPSEVSDTQAFYYRETRGRLKVTDYDWYLIDEEIILREKKES